MEPTVVTPKKQTYAGMDFRPNSEGYFKTDDGKSLSRTRYSAEYGNIPHGWEVHHRDGNKSRNMIRNLVALAPLDHYKEHSTQWTVPLKQLTCQQCGNAFEARWARAKYCRTTCRIKAYKIRNKQPR